MYLTADVGVFEHALGALRAVLGLLSLCLLSSSWGPALLIPNPPQQLAWDRKPRQWQSTAVGLVGPSWFTSLFHKRECCHHEAPDLSKYECLILWVILSSSYALDTVMAVTISYSH